MKNITEIQTEYPEGVFTTHIIIDHGNGEFTSMLKSTYDEMMKKAQEVKP
jgi:hypothetical protein